MNTGSPTKKEQEMKTSEKKLTKPPLQEMREAELEWYGHGMKREESDPGKLAGDREENKA